MALISLAPFRRLGGPEEAAAMARVIIEESGDNAGPGGPREEDVPFTYAPSVGGPGVKEPPGRVFGFRFPLFSLFVEGFFAAWRSFAKRNGARWI